MIATTFSPARNRALTLWRQHPRELIASGAMVLALAIGGTATSTPSIGEIRDAQAPETAPAPPPLLVRDIPVAEAAAVNGHIPLANGPNPAATPFSLAKFDAGTRAQALECLSQAVYYEAGSQSDDGERAVAQVVLNRVRHPAFPSSVCGVVYQGSTRLTGCQFTFTCDGSLLRRPSADGWARAKRIAEAALNGAVYAPVGLATHYHADYVVPYWASTLAKNAVVGAHLFYRWAGGWGKPAAFTQAYARQEPSASVLKSTALSALAARPARALQAIGADQLAEIPGAETEKAPPGRIAVRFKLSEARAAVEKAVEEKGPKPYVETMAASDNLRWTLSGNSPAAAPQKPLGPAPAAPAAAAPAGSN